MSPASVLPVQLQLRCKDLDYSVAKPNTDSLFSPLSSMCVGATDLAKASYYC